MARAGRADSDPGEDRKSISYGGKSKDIKGEDQERSVGWPVVSAVGLRGGRVVA